MRRIILQLSLATWASCAQPKTPEPPKAPLRDLKWGQLNFLHTTDTHGWHAGHLLEPSYTGDWGDYISFAQHMREIADREGWDMLLVDTGDRIEGNGLYDASDPQGKYTFDIFKQQDIDIICSGNHELYKSTSFENEYNITVPNFKGNYLASNLDIYDTDTQKFKPLAKRYRKFTTKNQGIRITAFGFLFDFTFGANNTFVQPVADTIREDWFKEAISDREVDLFVVTGHVAVRSSEFDLIYKAIRDKQWDTPIYFFGGHTHIRDYKKYDKSAYALESGRYMETIGFASIKGLPTKKGAVAATSNLEFSRSYIDNNRYSMYHHSATNDSNFLTELGKNVSSEILVARKSLGLDTTYGCAPQDYWVNRAPYDAKDSIFKWLETSVLPDQIRAAEGSTKKPKIAVQNTGAMRFDIFKGPFTRDSTFIVSPFTSGLRYIKDVDYNIAKRLIEVLNNEGHILTAINPDLDFAALPPAEELALRNPEITALREEHHEVLRKPGTQTVLQDEPKPVPGYTTVDDAGKDGDDTVHSPIQYYNVPNCFQAEIDFPAKGEAPESVDVMYNSFIQPYIIAALQFLGREYDEHDTHDYADGKSFTQLIADWIGQNWPCEESD